ncbi:MAG: glycosyltransferase family 2 protein [Spirochaetales bacterium]|nr:glycosyltransferase family 2 protein [Spirochaetales bacterium]
MASRQCSIVIPALDEEKGIGETLKSIRATEEANSLEIEIVVIDDGSIDQTGEIARGLGATVVRHPSPAGYGHSLKDGIRAARFDTIIITDADGTYPLDQIPALLTRYQQGFDMVVGARTGSEYRESVLKLPLRFILKWLVEFTTGRKIPDINSGFRIFSRATALNHLDRLCNTFSFTTGMTLAYMLTGRFVDYIPIAYHKRKGKSKVRLFRDSLRTMQYIVDAILFYNPIKLFIVYAMSLALLFLCFLGLYLYTDHFFFAGLALACFGLIFFILALGLISGMLRQFFLPGGSLPRNSAGQ